MFDPENVKAAVTVSRYFDDQGIKRRGTRAVAAWRGGENFNVALNDERGTWHDFVTSEHGDVISLCQKVEGLDFKAALDALGNRYGANGATGNVRKATRRPHYVPTPSKEELAERRRILLQKACRDFVPNLCATCDAAIMAYYRELAQDNNPDMPLTQRRKNAALQLRVLFTSGERIWAGSIVSDEATRKRLGIPYAKTNLRPWRGLDGDALALARHGIFDAFALADAIERGDVEHLPSQVSLNPVAGTPDAAGSFDSSQTIADFRHVLVEFDELFDVRDGVKIPSDEQLRLVANLNAYAVGHLDCLHVVSATYSGGKSIHVVLRIPSGDAAAYKGQTAALHDIFASADEPRFRADVNSWASGYAHVRLAGAIRPETGRLQNLLECDF